MDRMAALRLLLCLSVTGLLACPEEGPGTTEPTPCGDTECAAGDVCVIEDIFTPNEPAEINYICQTISNPCDGPGNCECQGCSGEFCRCEDTDTNVITCILDDDCGV